MPVYRYRQEHVSIARLSKQITGAVSISAAAPSYVDISAVSGSKLDLDDAMAIRGYVYVSTDPVDTPTAALSTDLGGAAFDPRDLLVFDHFVTGNNGSDTLGSAGWRVLSSGTGADVTLDGFTGHPGIIDFGAGSTAAGRVAIYLGESGAPSMLLSGTQNQIELEMLFRLNAAALLLTSNERITLGFGDQWGAAASVEHSNGCYLEFRPADAVQFRIVTANGGTRTKTSTSFTPVAATWYRIGLKITYPGGTPTFALSVNGTQLNTATANFPTATLGVGARMDAEANALEPRFQLDYVLMKQITAKET